MAVRKKKAAKKAAARSASDRPPDPKAADLVPITDHILQLAEEAHQAAYVGDRDGVLAKLAEVRAAAHRVMNGHPVDEGQA